MNNTIIKGAINEEDNFCYFVRSGAFISDDFFDSVVRIQLQPERSYRPLATVVPHFGLRVRTADCLARNYYRPVRVLADMDSLVFSLFEQSYLGTGHTSRLR